MKTSVDGAILFKEASGLGFSFWIAVVENY
jgi:hypothetical protein